MKKTFIFLLAVLALASCGKKTPATQNKLTAGMEKSQPRQGLIAYVEYDSLMTQYEYCKEYSEQLQQRSANYHQQLATKQRALATAAESFQRKLQGGQFSSQAEAEAEQGKLQNQQAQLERLGAELEQKFAEEQEAINTALHDSVQNFLREFNKDGRYSIILSKAGDNLLYADPKLDITEQVVSGLNKRYKKASKK